MNQSHPISEKQSRLSVALLIVAFTLWGFVAGRSTKQTEAGRTAMGMIDTAATSPSSHWQSLFDGTKASLQANWRGYQQQSVPGDWRVEDSVLTLYPNAGGDLITKQKYGDFELKLQWKISEGGNSGIMYRGSEEGPKLWNTGPEMQVVDNEHYSNNSEPKLRAGANYALYAPSQDMTKPVGQWNKVRILALGDRVEHWLNGQKVVEYNLGSAEWKQRVANSKFNRQENYGKYKNGYIGLQNHGDKVWYRDIKIRPLD